MKDGITASVIVLGFNGVNFIERCLSSVLDQDCPDITYEVIYADNNSSDGSVDFVAHKFPLVKIIKFEQNLGFSEGNNQAADSARGRYLLFLNQDTIVHRRWLAEMIKTLTTDNNVKAGHAVGCPLNSGEVERIAPVNRGYISEITRYGTVEPSEISLHTEPIPTLHLGGGSMILNRDVIPELGYIFDRNFFAYCEDLDLGLRINGLGHQVVFIPKAICYHHREGRAELSKRTIRRTTMATRNRFLVYMKNMYADEFVLSLPYLFVGSIIKMGNMVQKPLNRLIYGLGMIPFTLYCLAAASIKIPRIWQDRKTVLSRRSSHFARFWLYQQLKSKR